MSQNKHAYLIIAHNNFMILDRLIRLLDDERNDIYIHIDKKVKNFDFKGYSRLAEKSRVMFIPSIKIQWAGYSLIQCELDLLKAAAAGNYDYYHLLSGVDLPLKTQDFIHNFFNRNRGKEFIHFDNKNYDAKNNVRVKYYHFPEVFWPKPENILSKAAIKALSRIILLFQASVRINRIKGLSITLQKGANWFSITGSMAGYILSKEDMIKKLFRYTRNGDEMFIQTLIWNSDFKTRLYNTDYDNNYRAIMRFIDWDRGTPYIWRNSDYQELIESEFLFARKFDEKVDLPAVDKIFCYLMNRQKTAVSE